MEARVPVAKELAGACEKHLSAMRDTVGESQTPGEAETPGLLLRELSEALHVISSIISRAHQRHLIIQHDVHRHPVRQLMHSAIIIEIPGPVPALQQWQYLRWNTPRKEQSPGSHQFQDKAGSLRGKITYKQLHRFGSDDIFVLDSS